MMHRLAVRPLRAVLPGALALLLTLGLAAPVQAVDAPGGPTLTAAEVDGNSLDVEFSAKLDTSSVPAARDFEVAVDGEQRAVAHAQVPNRHFVRLTLAERVVEGDTVTVSYTPGEQPLRARDGDEVEGFNAQSVTNHTSTPSLQSANARQHFESWKVVATFEGALDPGSIPSTSDFTITVNGVARQPTSIETQLDARPILRRFHTVASGGTIATAARGFYSNVTLLMSGPPLAPGDTVTLAYTKGRTPLRDVYGNEVPDFGPERVANYFGPARFLRADVDGTIMFMRLDQAITYTKLPAAADFTVTVGGVHRSLTQVHPRGWPGTSSFLILVLSAPVAAGGEVTLAYTRGGTPLQDEHGDEAESFGPVPVRNVGGPPEFNWAEVDGRTLSVWFWPSPDLDRVPGAGDFSVTVNGSNRAVSTASVVFRSTLTLHREVRLTLPEPVDSDDVVTVAYTPGVIPLRHEGGDVAPGFEPMPVANVTVPTSPLSLPELHPVRTLITASGSVGDLRRAVTEACPLGATVSATVDGEFVPFIPRWHGRIENQAFKEAFRDGLHREPLLVEDCEKL